MIYLKMRIPPFAVSSFRFLDLVELLKSRVELVISSLQCEKIVVTATLYDLALLKHHNGVGIADG